MPPLDLMLPTGAALPWNQLGVCDTPPLPPPTFVGHLEELRRIDELLATGPHVAVVWGPAGVGKSALVARWVFTRPGEHEVWWVHCPDGRGDLGLVELAQRRGLVTHGGLGERLRGVAAHLRARPCVLVFDGGGAAELRLPDLVGVKRIILARRSLPLPGLELMPLSPREAQELVTLVAPGLGDPLPPRPLRPLEVLLWVGLRESGQFPTLNPTLELPDLLPLLVQHLDKSPILHRCLLLMGEVGIPLSPADIHHLAPRVELGEGRWAGLRLRLRQWWGTVRANASTHLMNQAIRYGVVQQIGGGRLALSPEMIRLLGRGMGGDPSWLLPLSPPPPDDTWSLVPYRLGLASLLTRRSTPLDVRAAQLGRWLLRALEEEGDVVGALEACLHLVDRGGVQNFPGEWSGHAGRLALRAGKHGEARELLGQALAELNQGGEGGLSRARVLLPLAALERMGGQVELALTHLSEVQQLSEAYADDGVTRAACRVEQARCHMELERWADARATLGPDDLASFQSLAPLELLAVRQMLARICEELDQPHPALEQYQQAISLLEGQRHPPRGVLAELQQGLGRTLAATGRAEEALPAFQRAVSLRMELGEPRALGESLRSLGLCYKSLTQLGEARTTLERSIAVLDTPPRVDPLMLSVARFNLAQVLVEQGQLEAALGVFEEAARVVDTQLAVSHHLRCACHHAMGRLLVRLGRAGEAVPHLRGVVEGRTLVPPPERATLSASHHDLGLALLGSDHAAQAEAPFREALHLRELDLPRSSGQLSETVAALGQCVQRLGRVEEAIPLLFRALELSEATPEAHWTAAALACTDLGRLLLETSQPDLAEPTLRRVLALQERVLGPEHPVVAVTLTTLAQICSSRGSAAEALGMSRRALTVREQTLGPEQPETLHSMHHFGRALTAAGEVDKGMAVLGRAATLHQKVFGDEAPPTVGVLYSLGQSMLAAGRPGLALAPLQKVVSVERIQKGQTLVPALVAMGQSFAALARHGEAVQVLQEALKVEEPDGGTELKTVGVAATLHELGGALLASGQPSRAVPHFRRALAVWEKELGEHHLSTLNTRVELGHALLAEGKTKVALAQYERVYTALENMPEASSSRLVNHLLMVGQHLGRRSHLDEGQKWVERAAKVAQGSGDTSLQDKVELVLVSILVVQEPTMEAESRVQQVVDRRLASLGPHHPEVARARLVAAEIRLGRGHFGAARQRLGEALQDLRAGVNGAPPELEATLLATLAQAWSSAGEGAQAARVLEQKLKLDEGRLGALHASLASTRHELGCAWFLAGEFPQAAAALREAVVGRRRHLGSDHPATWISRFELARVEKEMGVQGAGLRMTEAVGQLTRLLGANHAHVALLRMQLGGGMD